MMMISSTILLAATLAQSSPTAAEAAAAEAAPPTSQPAATASPTDTTVEAVRLATEADVKVGATVNSKDGIAIGKVTAVDSTGAVIESEKIKAKVSLSGLGVNSKGLIIGMTKAEFESATTTRS